MAHYSIQDWQDYLQDRVDDGVAQAMEQHLARCQVCLELYISGAEKAVCPQVSSQFTDGVMDRVLSLRKPYLVSDSRAAKQGKGPSKKKPEATTRDHSSRQSLGNYAIAACLTLLLTAGGIFGGVASAVPQVKGLDVSFTAKAAQMASSGWSEEVAEKTLSILDVVKPD